MRIDLNTCEEILITITRNKTRSLLTAFGIFWGIFMLIALMGGTKGMQAMMSANFEGFATNSAFIGANKTSEAYKGFRKGRYWDVINEDVDIIRKQVEGIDVITSSTARWGGTVYFNDKKSSCVTKGVYPETVHIEIPKLLYGRYITDADVKENRKVCVIGKKIYESLFKSDENPCGKSIKIDGVYYNVVGVNITESNMNIQGSASESICIPMTTMQRAYNMGNRVHLICFTAKPGYKITDVAPKAEELLKERHLISPTDKQAVVLVNAEAMFSMMDNLFKGINILTWMVGLGTLFAGAIGVSNIMMVTVKERTTEIGIRRAIGARPKDILQQILSESVVLTSIAGMAGITFGVLILAGLEMVVNATGSNYQFQVSFGLAIGTGILLIALGTLAGLAPAYRAMAIRPIEAIRDE